MTVEEVIELLGMRLDQMATHRPRATTDWERAFDEGWQSARLQINNSILNPRIIENLRTHGESE